MDVPDTNDNYIDKDSLLIDAMKLFFGKRTVIDFTQH